MKLSVFKIFESEFVKNSSFLLIGTILSQGIGIIFMPLLARLYTPSAFGILTSFIAISSLLGHLANGKFGQVIVLPKEEKEATIIYKLSSRITWLIGILFFIVILFLYSISIIKENKIWIYFLPFVIVISGLVEINHFYLTRIKKFSIIAISKISQSLGNVLSSISFSFFSLFQQFGLVFGLIFGQLVAFLLTRSLVNKSLNSFSEKLNRTIYFDSAKKYKYYSIYGIPGAFIDSIAQQIPVYYLLFYFDNTTIGYYGLAVRVVQVPGILIASSINSVLFQKFSELNSSGLSLKPLVLKTAKLIAKFSLLPMIVLAIISPLIFPLIFGDEWRMSGNYAQILFLIYGIRIIVSPITTVFAVKDKLKGNFKWQILYFVISVLFFLLMNLFSVSFYNTLIAFVIIEFLLYGLYFYLAYKIS